jgi:DNA-binding Xre family transcriptional regulator
MIRWTLRQCISGRNIKVTALAEVIGVSRQKVSGLKKYDYLPKIDAQDIEEIRRAIESLSCDRYGECKTSEIVKVED